MNKTAPGTTKYIQFPGVLFTVGSAKGPATLTTAEHGTLTLTRRAPAATIREFRRIMRHYAAQHVSP